MPIFRPPRAPFTFNPDTVMRPQKFTVHFRTETKERRTIFGHIRSGYPQLCVVVQTWVVAVQK
ncbi:hypothetical protein PILCRDRAFT_814587 [Piloderma croceum F 1598]|uniref:Uncharacterized protein n=1 Tax=Piloderma croceum (strain F 1598) TaxID=765440 RepID=A0A0C3FU43_PILCF|nr:hypothetical protein PILCRDRAFT_814587 [Piloderma croceum F 1598]